MVFFKVSLLTSAATIALFLESTPVVSDRIRDYRSNGSQEGELRSGRIQETLKQERGQPCPRSFLNAPWGSDSCGAQISFREFPVVRGNIPGAVAWPAAVERVERWPEKI